MNAIYSTIGTSLLSFFVSLLEGYRDSRKADKLQVGEEFNLRSTSRREHFYKFSGVIKDRLQYWESMWEKGPGC